MEICDNGVASSVGGETRGVLFHLLDSDRALVRHTLKRAEKRDLD